MDWYEIQYFKNIIIMEVGKCNSCQNFFVHFDSQLEVEKKNFDEIKIKAMHSI